jgi:hypothetical protein
VVPENATAWIDLHQLGLRLVGDTCRHRPYLLDELKASLD